MIVNSKIALIAILVDTRLYNISLKYQTMPIPMYTAPFSTPCHLFTILQYFNSFILVEVKM